jgi:hypothetical protein
MTTSGTTTSGATTGGQSQLITEIFTHGRGNQKKIDILWVVDNSNIMKNWEIDENLSSFTQIMISKNVDFKMAITTTDCSNVNKCGKTVPTSDDVLNVANALSNPRKFGEDFERLMEVGSSGSKFQMGLRAADEFILKDFDPDKANKFLRQEAHLAIVFISREDDGSGAVAGSLPFMTVKKYTDALNGLKMRNQLLKTYFIVDKNDMTPYVPGGQPENLPGSARYKAAAVNTRGAVMDVYGNFSANLSEINSDMDQLLNSHVLSSVPVSGSIKVYVNNIQTTQFTYNQASHSISFNAGFVPPLGASIKITYAK